MEIEYKISDALFENVSVKLFNYLLSEIHQVVVKKFKKEQNILFVCLEINQQNIFTPIVKVAIEEPNGIPLQRNSHLPNYKVIEIPIKEKSVLKDHLIIKEFFNERGRDGYKESIQILSEISQELNTWKWKEEIRIHPEFVICLSQNNQTNSDLYFNSVPSFKFKKSSYIPTLQ